LTGIEVSTNGVFVAIELDDDSSMIAKFLYNMTLVWSYAIDLKSIIPHSFTIDSSTFLFMLGTTITSKSCIV